MHRIDENVAAISPHTAAPNSENIAAKNPHTPAFERWHGESFMHGYVQS